MNKFSSRKAFTLIEITLVLGLTLGLAAALIFGLAAFQQGADRAKCLMNISNVQKAVRSWANLNEVAPGTQLAGVDIFPGNDFVRLWGTPTSFLGSRPACPRDAGVLARTDAALAQMGGPQGYNHSQNRSSRNTVNNPSVIPVVGSPYINCLIGGFGVNPRAGETFHQPCEIDGVASASNGGPPPCQR